MVVKCFSRCYYFPVDVVVGIAILLCPYVHLLRAVDFLRLLDLNDVVWLLNLVLKFLAVSPMYISVPVSELTLAWYIKHLARQLPLSGHLIILLQLHVDWSVTCVLLSVPVLLVTIFLMLLMQL